MGRRGVVMFPAYRSFEVARVAANDAMMALLASSRLGTHVLTLHAGSAHRLGGLLAAMAIPFVLSVHKI